MTVYKDSDGRVVEVRRSGANTVVVTLIVLAVLAVGFLFATGFWSAKVKDPGALPSVAVKTTPGEMPNVDLDSKKIVVGTKQTSVDVPVVKTKKESIDVPVVGVKP